MSPERIREGDIPGVQLRLRGKLAIDAEEGWRWLTDPAKMGRWLGEVTERSAEALTLTSTAADGSPVRELLATRERHPPRLWSAALRPLDRDWQAATLVTFELIPRSPGCELSILQQGFQQLKLSTCLTEWERYRRRWRRAVRRLERAADA